MVKVEVIVSGCFPMELPLSSSSYTIENASSENFERRPSYTRVRACYNGHAAHLAELYNSAAAQATGVLLVLLPPVPEFSWRKTRDVQLPALSNLKVDRLGCLVKVGTIQCCQPYMTRELV